MATITVDIEKCKGCVLCIHFCPKKVIAVSSGINSKGYHPAELTDEEHCTGCAICAIVCPDVAIEVWR